MAANHQPTDPGGVSADATRSRIIDATFHVLMEKGYAGASTREIARRARVSKRELYVLFDGKDGIFAAMIASRAARMRQPLLLPDATDRASLTRTLAQFGSSLLHEGSNPAVTAVLRLAVAEAERAPALARHLDENGRQPTRTALSAFLARAGERGLLGNADPQTAATQFLALLWGELQMGLLLSLAESPPAEEVERRVNAAVTAILTLYPERVSPAG